VEVCSFQFAALSFRTPFINSGEILIFCRRRLKYAAKQEFLNTAKGSDEGYVKHAHAWCSGMKPLLEWKDTAGGSGTDMILG